METFLRSSARNKKPMIWSKQITLNDCWASFWLTRIIEIDFCLGPFRLLCLLEHLYILVVKESHPVGIVAVDLSSCTTHVFDFLEFCM